MLNKTCLECELKENCEKVGIAMHEMQKLIFLMGQDNNDPFALGMVQYTLKKRSGDFSSFQELLANSGKIRRCWFQ